MKFTQRKFAELSAEERAPWEEQARDAAAAKAKLPARKKDKNAQALLDPAAAQG